MRMEYVLNVSDKELYTLFINNLKLEMDILNIHKGMVIKKKLGKNSEMKIEVLNLEKDKLYSLKYSTNRGTNIVTYSIEKLDKYKTKLIYEDSYLASSIFHMINYQVLGAIYRYFFKRKRERLFKKIEEYIISNRGKIDD